MTDLDHMQRRITDLEAIVRDQGYRIKALEKAGESMTYAPNPSAPPGYGKMPEGIRCRCIKQWTDGRGNYWCCKGEVHRRAPDCPSHKE